MLICIVPIFLPLLITHLAIMQSRQDRLLRIFVQLASMAVAAMVAMAIAG
jgi:hypothetical protein